MDASASRELVRWTVVALCAGLGYLAWSCPCKTIFGCHQRSATAAVVALGLLTVGSAFSSAGGGSKA